MSSESGQEWGQLLNVRVVLFHLKPLFAEEAPSRQELKAHSCVWNFSSPHFGILGSPYRNKRASHSDRAQYFFLGCCVLIPRLYSQVSFLVWAKLESSVLSA